MGSSYMRANREFIEHRWGTRVTLEAPAWLRTAQDAPLDVVLSNASLSGAYVRTSLRAPLLSCVLVRMVGGTSDWLDACVVRHDATGMGLEWIEPGVRSVSALLALRHGGQMPVVFPSTTLHVEAAEAMA
jgi:hypothetical protein